MKPTFHFFLYTGWVALLSLFLAACGASATPVTTGTPTQAVTQLASATGALPSPAADTPSPVFTASATGTASPVPLPTHTSTDLPTPTPVPSSTATITPVPTYVKLRGQVIIAQAVCHYGPGKPYLYKYGVYEGSNLEIIGRDPQANYVEIQAIGGNNPCWVKAEYLKIKGDIMNVRPVDPRDWKLPSSPYYGPLTGVGARRDGSEVTIGWNPLVLKAGDDSLQVPYVVEAWTCQGGQIVFTPVGANQTTVKITDEPGCSEPSHARVTAAEKHGYTRFVEVPWPPAEGSPSPTPTP